MSNRERWVVYPLLFMSLGMSLTNGLERQEKAAMEGRAQENRGNVEVGVLRCKTLEIVAPNGAPRWQIGTTAAGEGSLDLIGKDNTLQAQLQGNPSGALLSLFHNQDRVGLHLGFDNEEARLLITDRAGRSIHSWISIPILPAGAIEPISPKINTDDSESAPKSKPEEKSPASENESTDKAD
jgi:hypothetical protein